MDFCITTTELEGTDPKIVEVPTLFVGSVPTYKHNMSSLIGNYQTLAELKAASDLYKGSLVFHTTDSNKYYRLYILLGFMTEAEYRSCEFRLPFNEEGWNSLYRKIDRAVARAHREARGIH